MSRATVDLEAAYHCAAEVIRRRCRTGEPIPERLRRHYNQLDLEMRLSVSGHGSSWDTRQLEHDTSITARQAADILGCSKRQAQRLAPDLDGQIVDGRWLFKLKNVMEYAKGKQHG
jgi:hypothetical protein